MSLTFQQALDALNGMTNPTVNDLRTLVNQIDVASPSGSTTLLYSGQIAKVSGETVTSRQVAQGINATNTNLAIIDNTAAGQFLVRLLGMLFRMR